MSRLISSQTQAAIYVSATAQQSARFVIEEKTSISNFRDSLRSFLVESTEIIRTARKEMREKYPTLLS